MKVTINHNVASTYRSRSLTAACRANYDHYTLGLTSCSERGLDPYLRLASSIGDGDEAEASYRLAVATQVMEESEESCD